MMDATTLAMFRALEENLWRGQTRFDNTLMVQTFADDFIEFGKSGRTYTRAEMLPVESGGGEINAALPLPNFVARFLSDDVVQVTYVSKVTRGNVVEVANRSSSWSRVGEGWKLRFHQGTPTG